MTVVSVRGHAHETDRMSQFCDCCTFEKNEKW